jgi:hypothetical protein
VSSFDIVTRPYLLVARDVAWPNGRMARLSGDGAPPGTGIGSSRRSVPWQRYISRGLYLFRYLLIRLLPLAAWWDPGSFAVVEAVQGLESGDAPVGGGGRIGLAD